MNRTLKNPINKRIIEKRNKIPVTFNMERGLSYESFFKSENRSDFINSAVRFYLTWLDKPVKIMQLCKQRNLALYKWVLRKKHYI